MGQGKPNVWRTRFKQFMAPDTINAIGHRVGLCQRRRQVTSWRLTESPRLFRRLVGLSHAALADSSSC